MIFLGRSVPQSNGAGYFPTGGSDTFGSERGMFYQLPIPSASPAVLEVFFGPFRSNVGYQNPDYMRRSGASQTVNATSTDTSNGQRNFFRITYTFSTEDLGGGVYAYYINWGTYDPNTGAIDPLTLNTFPADDEDVAVGVIGATVSFDYGSVVLTSASTRGSASGLGDFIGNYDSASTPSSPGNIVSITPP